MLSVDPGGALRILLSNAPVRNLVLSSHRQLRLALEPLPLLPGMVTVVMEVTEV